MSPQDDGGYVVPMAFVDQLAEASMRSMDAVLFEILRDKRTWNQRLADDIAARSIRNRFRRRTRTLRDIPRRLANARAALRGAWEASDDW